jgi:hypothetical protein
LAGATSTLTLSLLSQSRTTRLDPALIRIDRESIYLGDPMMRSKFLFTGPFLLAAALATSSCGDGRQLQSVTLVPASADAKDYPNSQIPMTATGAYSKPPSPVLLTSNDIVWCIGTSDGTCNGNIASPVIVDINGVAQCSVGQTGTATVLAGKPSSKAVKPDSPSQLKVFGAAQVTCP